MEEFFCSLCNLRFEDEKKFKKHNREYHVPR